MKPVKAMQPVLKQALMDYISQPSQNLDDWVNDTLENVFAAWHFTHRYVVIVVEPGAQYAYGPYASRGSAESAIEKGHVGTKEGARAAILTLTPAAKTR
jgi:hypothetical protein